MSMPTSERRYFLSLLIKNTTEQQERAEQQKTVQKGKGSKTTRVGGEALKNKIKSGGLPK